MALSAVLSSALLRRLAGPASYLRGEAYWRDGLVRSCQLSGDALVGVVRGGAAYQVRVSERAGRFESDCTCPVGDSFCKHAVALSLEHLEQLARGARPPTTAAASPRSEAAGFRTPGEVEAWAARHEVTHVLRGWAGDLTEHLPAGMGSTLRYQLGPLSLLEIASHEGTERYVAPVATALVAAARAALDQEVQRVELATVEEAARFAALPEALGPSSLALWNQLAATRRSVRAYASPRPRAWRAGESWSFDAAGPAVTWTERTRLVRDRGVSLSTKAQLTISGTEVRLECSCMTGAARCAHALALLDATFDLLEDPARREQAEQVARELLRPSWSRALEELARHEAKPVKVRPVIEVWWRIERELGSLTLVPTVKKVTRTGALTAGARTSVRRLLDEHRDALEPRDLTIAEHLLAWDPMAGRASSYPVRAFLAAVGHPRLVAEDSTTTTPATAVALERVALGFTALPAGELIRLEPSIDGARFEPRLLGSLLGSFLPHEPLFTPDPASPRMLLIDVNEEARRLWAVLRKHGDTFPPESHVQLLEQLALLERRLPLAIPGELKGKRIDGDSRTVVRLRLLPDHTLELELFVRPGEGAPLYAPGAGPRDVLLVRAGERTYVRRELATEAARARAALDALPLDPACTEEGPPGCVRVLETDAALRLVAALDPPPPGIEAEWLGERATVGGTIAPKQLRITIDQRRDWFGISGDVKVETGRLELAVLLDAARRQKRYVRVGEHRWMELSDLLRARLGAISDQTFVGKQRLELSPGAVPAIRALADAGAQVEPAPAWAQLTARLDAAMRLRPRPPPTLNATLRDYQVEGHAWLSRIAAWGAGCCLADDMGLGKTVQAIALLLDRAKLGPALVLAPTSVCWNWTEELARFAPSLRPVIYAEQQDRAACLAKLGKRDVLIVSYGLLVRDADKLAACAFGTLVIDEAQALKNAATRRAKAARALRAEFRVALSGTPLENHLGELWSLFAIVFPGLLGSWEQFRDRFASPIERGKNPEVGAALSRVIRPFLLRRTKDEVARELPPRTEIQVPIALSHDEHELYEDARLAAVAELSRQGKGVRDEQHRFQVLAALTRLRLLASHPRLYDATSVVTSSKLRRLVELLEELREEGHRALVFSQFTSHLALVRAELEGAGWQLQYLDGSTPAGQRKARVKAFQDGAGDVFLISLKAGGTGLNLTAADYVIHLDPWWNPAVEDQASDRAHRIGQTKPVTVYRLIARGTIEEKILSMHADKRALVAGILDGTDVAARLTTRDLLALLASGPAAAERQDDEGVGPRGKRPKLTLVP